MVWIKKLIIILSNNFNAVNFGQVKSQNSNNNILRLRKLVERKNADRMLLQTSSCYKARSMLSKSGGQCMYVRVQRGILT